MGFDLFGVKPRNDSGQYFRASIWSWPGIHMLIEDTGVLNDEELEAIGYNDGYFIPDGKALLIAERMEKLIADAPEGASYVNPNSKLAQMGEALINAFVGQGVTVERGDSQFVDIGYVKTFIDFARNSGGFEVT